MNYRRSMRLEPVGSRTHFDHQRHPSLPGSLHLFFYQRTYLLQFGHRDIQYQLVVYLQEHLAA